MTDDAVHPLRSNRLPLSSQAQSYLRSLIESGTYQPGSQLPSENELAIQLGISRPTLREALRNLEQQGIIVRRHGVGTFVASAGERLDTGLERLESVHQMAARQELQLRVRALQVQQLPADREIAAILAVAPGTPLTSVDRVIAAAVVPPHGKHAGLSQALRGDETPIAYLYDVAAATLLSPGDVSDQFNGSVLDLLRQKTDLHIGQAVANIVSTNAEADLSRKLAIKPRRAVLLLEETLYDDKGKVLEYSRNYFNPDYFRFRVVRR
jgi:GntR family transcriptional regulator